MPHVYKIREFGTITIGSSDKPFSSNELEVDDKTFNGLIDFVEENQGNENIDKAFLIFRKKGKRYISVKNYVGVIETRNKVAVEILPKTYIGKAGEEADEYFSKMLLIKMLKTIQKSPFIHLNIAHLKEQTNFPLLEVFITSYLDELALLTSKELRGDYVKKEDNLRYIKGKLLIHKNIKRNSFDKSVFYCQYDDFNTDIPPNKLIKSTLLRLKTLTSTDKNKKKCIKMLQHFEQVSSSVSIESDLSYCQTREKLLKSYGNLLKWSEVFLKNKSFINFHGSTVNQAILFPMERLFESYIAYLLRKNCNGFSIQAPDNKYFLLSQKKSNEDPEFTINKFLLKPDVVLNESEIIIDTKWKIINSSSKKYDIKEGDVYQMHAYGMRYSENSLRKPRLALIYPKNPNFENILPQFRFGQDIYLDVIPFDFGNEDSSDEIKRIIDVLRPKSSLLIKDDIFSLAADSGLKEGGS